MANEFEPNSVKDYSQKKRLNEADIFQALLLPKPDRTEGIETPKKKQTTAKNSMIENMRPRHEDHFTHSMAIETPENKHTTAKNSMKESVLEFLSRTV